MILTLMLRIITNRIIDGTVFYDHVIARLSFNVLGMWLFFFVMEGCSAFSDLSARIAGSALWKMMDRLSYTIFLTHYMFLTAPFNLKGFFSNRWWIQIAVLRRVT